MRNFLKGRLLPVRICLIVSMVSLIGIGIATIYGYRSLPTNQARPVMPPSWPAIGRNNWFSPWSCGGFVAANLVNYRRLGAASHSIYLMTVVLLAVILLGKHVPLSFVPQRGGIPLDRVHDRLTFPACDSALGASSSPISWRWRGDRALPQQLQSVSPWSVRLL